MHRRGSRITLRNEAVEMLRVADWLATAANDFGLTADIRFRLDLLLNEALPNIFAYAWPDPGEHSIELELSDEPEQVWLEIRDDGIAFDPLARAPRPADDSLETASVTGRGIQLMRSFSDLQSYERRDGCNRLRLGLYKQRSGESPMPG